MGDPKIRLATLSEMDALERVMKESTRELSEGYYDAAQIESAVRYIAVPDPEIIGDGTYFAVEMDGEIVGCGGWSRRRKLFTGTAEQEGMGGEWLDPAQDPARIRAMFVSSRAARKGIGRAIFDECEAAARAWGFRSLALMATLPGVPFYLKAGFIEQERVEMKLPDGVVVPGIQMTKPLSPDP